MRKKIFNTISLTAIIAIVLVYITSGAIFYFLITNYSKEQVKTEASIIATQINDNHLDIDNEDLVLSDMRVTIINDDGSVAYDSQVDKTAMSNHSNRPEFVQAQEKGTGESLRESDTFSIQMFYYAIKLDNGQVVRVGRSFHSFLGIIINGLLLILPIGFIIIIICMLLARRQTARIVDPINNLNLDVPLSNHTYPELQPLLNNIDQHNQMRKEFSANVSHELKTPLTSISGYAEIMANGIAKPEDQKKFATTIYNESQSLIYKINDIIKISKLDEESVELEQVTVDFPSIVNKCLERLDKQINYRHIQVHTSLNSASGIAIPYVMEDILFNLILNAIKYNKDNGNVWISTEQTKNEVIIVIKDDGMGIPEEDMPRIYERFFRGDKAHSHTIEGSGLGLAIVKHGVMLHHGTIQCDSKLNEGTTFTIKIPNNQETQS